MKKLERLLPSIILACTVLAFILGIVGYHDPDVIESLRKQSDDTYKEEFHWFNTVYTILGMFLMAGLAPNFQSWPILIATYAAALVLGVGILMLVLQSATNWLNLLRIRYIYRGHTIIMGNNRIGYRIAMEMLHSGKKVVAIENKDQLDENILNIREEGGILLTASASQERDLINAGIEYARYCLILTANDEDNLQSANILSWLNQREGRIKGPLTALMHVEDAGKRAFLKDFLDLYNRTANYDIEVFSVDMAAAQLVYDSFPPLQNVQYQAIKDKKGEIENIAASPTTILMVGYNQAAQQFLKENIILSHSPGLRNLKIVLIDQGIEERMREILFQFPFIRDYLDVEGIELEDGSFQSPIFNSTTFRQDLRQLGGVYVFGDDDTYLISLAKSIRQLLYAECNDLNTTPIVAVLPERSKAINLLSPKELQSEGRKIALFETLREEFNINLIRTITDTCTKSKLIDEIDVIVGVAKTINYFYSLKYEFVWLVKPEERERITEQVLAEAEHVFLNMQFHTNDPLKELEMSILSVIAKPLGLMREQIAPLLGIHARWNALSDLKQDSNRYVARHLDSKVRFIHQMGHQEITQEVVSQYFKVFASVEHKRWCSEKMAYQFRFGALPASNPKLMKSLKDLLKVHDQLIPYEQLTKEMEDKDFNMFLMIPVLIEVRRRLKTQDTGIKM